MMLAAKMDEFGKAGWIAATVLGFILWWPVGLAALAFICLTGRLRGHCGPYGAGRWHNMGGPGSGGGCGWGRRGRARWGANSGNQAFDDYRSETLRRLEEEQQEFQAYLERLRRAKDKAEFDQFMADRRSPGRSRPDETV